jgi:2-dehydro-3-deoxyphosphooctonate aldolase (KDO 8-P synthase)
VKTKKQIQPVLVKVGKITIGKGQPLTLIAGPCVVEDRETTLRTAEKVVRITSKLGIPYIFKSSFKKANRSSVKGFTTIGIEKALAILAEVKEKFYLPILTDVHTAEEVSIASEVADVLQIPAFLCRQTDLLQAAGSSGKVINVKKGQFLAPEEMSNVIEKIKATGNNNILLTERGTTFGYHNLVVDMRSLVIMRELGYPVVLDATHSVQLPGGEKNQSGGQPQFIYPLARAGVAVGCDALFLEVHPNPPRALSDPLSQLKLDLLEPLLKQVIQIEYAVKKFIH